MARSQNLSLIYYNVDAWIETILRIIVFFLPGAENHRVYSRLEYLGKSWKYEKKKRHSLTKPAIIEKTRWLYRIHLGAIKSTFSE
jgi:hypothetical protein